MSKRFWKIDDPLFESLPNYDKIKIQNMLDQWQAGNVNIKDELTLQLLALCKVILQKKLYKNPNLQRGTSDLIGTLMLRTCTWMDELFKHQSACLDPFKYYCQIIKNAINRFTPDDPGVTGSGPHKNHCKYYKQGRSMPVRIKLKKDLLQVNPTLILDFEDVLLALAETEREQKVIILRFQGYTDLDIAKQLKIDESTVSRLRSCLEKRYDEYLQNEHLV